MGLSRLSTTQAATIAHRGLVVVVDNNDSDKRQIIGWR
jgi:hypothetical protein